MLPKSTLERLQSFKLPGFIDALIAQMESAKYADLSFEERLTLLIDTEYAHRLDRRTKRMLNEARLPSSATLEDVDFTIQRGIKKQSFLEIAQGNWLTTGTNIIITGPTGTGKTFVGSVLARGIIVRGSSVRFQRTNLWLSDLHSYVERRRLQQTLVILRRIPLLVFDEWLLDQISQADARLLLELFESRYLRSSCMFITQLPVASWHSRFEDPTLADAILDRILHNSIRIELQGESMRKLRAPDTSRFQEQYVASPR